MASILIYNQRGKYTISFEILADHPGVAQLIYSQGIILRASWADAFGEIEYIAVSHWFRALSAGEIVPTYTWEVDGTVMKIISCTERTPNQERNTRYFYL